MKTGAVVLAAGRSRRMGRPKAWLRLDGETLLARIVRTASTAGAAPVIVVCGSESDDALVSCHEVRARLFVVDAPSIQTVVGSPDADPIDSLRAGLARLPQGHALLLWPVDAPFAGPTLVTGMMAALAGSTDHLVVPSVNGQWGHPVLLGPEVAAELATPVADRGAHRVVGRNPARVIEVLAKDPRIVREVNTPDQAAALGLTMP